jgi:enoyl-CoA hydratase/carnithine racemase
LRLSSRVMRRKEIMMVLVRVSRLLLREVRLEVCRELPSEVRRVRTSRRIRLRILKGDGITVFSAGEEFRKPKAFYLRESQWGSRKW